MAKEKLTTTQVLHIARLCDLTLSDDEVKKLSEMLTEAIDYIKILEELDTTNTPETYQVTGLVNVFQSKADKNTTLSKDDALANAKEVIKGMIATKAVFER
jgi:aspartyl/glutamyl-tRNA(Asn/Gln) amidotransferase C subunit